MTQIIAYVSAKVTFPPLSDTYVTYGEHGYKHVFMQYYPEKLRRWFIWAQFDQYSDRIVTVLSELLSQ